MSDIRHVAIYGMTMQGKGLLVKALSKIWLKAKRPVYAFNPLQEGDWPPGTQHMFTVDQLEAFLKARYDALKAGKPLARAFLVLDEAYYLKKQTRKHHVMVPVVGNMGRHLKLTIYVLTQFPTAVDHALRLNTAECFCFALGGRKYAEKVWEDFNFQELDGKRICDVIMRLQPLECVHLTKTTAEIKTIHHLKNRTGRGAKTRTTARADTKAQPPSR